MTYIIELTADRAEAGLGGSSLYLAYVHSLYRAFLAPTRIVLDCYGWDYIRLVYAIDIQHYIHLPLLPIAAAAARALSTINICLAYVFFITNLASPN